SLLPRAGAPAVVIERRTLTCWERLSWRHESSFGSRLVDKTDRQRPKPAPSAIRLSIALTAAPDAQSRSWPDDGFGAPGAAGLDADGRPCWQVGKSEYWDWTGDPPARSPPRGNDRACGPFSTNVVICVKSASVSSSRPCRILLIPSPTGRCRTTPKGRGIPPEPIVTLRSSHSQGG